MKLHITDRTRHQIVRTVYAINRKYIIFVSRVKLVHLDSSKFFLENYNTCSDIKITKSIHFNSFYLIFSEHFDINQTKQHKVPTEDAGSI